MIFKQRGVFSPGVQDRFEMDKLMLGRRKIQNLKNDFKKVLIEDLDKKEWVIIYLYCKSLSQFHEQIKSAKKRISVIA